MTDPALFPEAVPVLTDGRVLLRAHRPEDAARMVEQCQDPDTLRWTTIPRPYGPEHAASFLEIIEASWNEPGAHRFWAIADAAEPDLFLGTIDIRPVAGGTASLGFGLHPQGRGRGLMAAAVRLACAWWFAQGGTRVHWQAVAGNIGSWAVARAAGFTWHGVLPEALEHPLLDGSGRVCVDAWQASLAAGATMAPQTPWFATPVVELGDLRLRPWRASDVEALEAPIHPEHFIPTGSWPEPDTFGARLTRQQVRAITGQCVVWCIADAASDRALGELLLFAPGGPLGDHAELGYLVLPSAAGHGVSTRAARYGVEHAFRRVDEGGLGVRRLTAMTVEDNAASIRVLERLGFTRFGRESAVDLLADGSTRDLLHWELLAPR